MSLWEKERCVSCGHARHEHVTVSSREGTCYTGHCRRCGCHGFVEGLARPEGLETNPKP